MISTQRLKYLNDNRHRGDVTQAIEVVNKKSEFTLTKATANEILKGKMFGTNGHAFTNALETIIKKRLAKLARESKKYSQAHAA